MGNIIGVTYSNQRVSAADHAALFGMFISDGILWGCSVSSSLNTFYISEGAFISAGRMAKIQGREEIIIPSSQSGGYARVKLVNDMSQVAEQGNFGQVYFAVEYAATADGFPALRQENINSQTGQVYEIAWAILTIGDQGIISNIDLKVTSAQGSGGGTGTGLPEFTFSGGEGTYIFTEEGNGDWNLKILSSGNLVFANLGNALGGVDVFMVGGGGGGGGRAGGGGGYTKTLTQQVLQRGTTYQLVIGAGGAGGSYSANAADGGPTTGFGETANGGKGGTLVDGGDGGSGGGAYTAGIIAGATNQALGGTDGGNGQTTAGSPRTNGIGQGETTKAFKELTGDLYASGGCGCSVDTNDQYQKSSGTGGASGYGGYASGGNPTTGGEAGAPNTGNGGGAGPARTGGTGLAGSGGSGIIIIRNHRSSSAA